MQALKRNVIGLAIGAALLALAVPATAQTSPDTWSIVLSPYMMGASMSGSTTVRGFEADVDVSASDIFSNLQFGFMGMMAARKGNWGVGGDVIYMALGTTVRETNVDFNQGGFAFYGLRKLGAAADLTFGMRVNTMKGQLDFKRLNRSVEQSKAWVDPLVGLLLRTPEKGRLGLRVYSEFGGFGVGSDFTWQVFPTVMFRVTERTSIDLGYRWLDIDYATGDGNEKFAYDVLSQGPVMGLTMRF